AQVRASLIAIPGSAQVTVNNSSCNHSSAVSIVITADPVITQVVSTTIPVSSSPTSIDVYGANLFATSVVQWNGTSLNTSMLSDGDRKSDVHATIIASAGRGQVQGKNSTGNPYNPVTA